MKNILPEWLIGTLFSIKSSITFSNSKFHKMFYIVKRTGEYSDLFDNITFSGSPVNPFSEVLDEALFNLQFAGALSRRNPGLIEYSTTNSFAHTYKVLSDGIDQVVKDKAKKLCDEILIMLDRSE